MSYTKGASGGAEIIEENNYYPFGLKHQGYNSSSLANNTYQYKYNGKELQETGMYDYGARMYMPELGRWGVVDPLAEKYPHISPYNYVANNPINAIDPNGKEIVFVAKNGQQLVYSKGNFYYANVVKDSKGNLSINNSGKKYDGRKDNVSTTLFRLARAYRKIESSNDNELKGALHHLEKSKNIHQIQEGTDNDVDIKRELSAKDYNGDGTITHYNFDSKTSDSDLTTTVHEMFHQFDYDINNAFGIKDSDRQSANSSAEQRAVKFEK